MSSRPVVVFLACFIATACARDIRDVSACSFGVSTGLCSLRPVGTEHVCNPCDSRSYIQCSNELAAEAHVLYCPEGKLFNPLTGSCDNAENVKLTCYDVISHPAAANQLAGAATHWRITNWFTYQQDKACGFLGSVLANLLRASTQCGKHVVLHSSGRSTTLTSTFDGQPAVVTTTTISSTSFEPRPLLKQPQPDSTSIPHFLDPDTLPDGPELSGNALAAAYLRGKQQQQQQQPTVVFHPDLGQLNLQSSRRDTAVPNAVLQQVIPRLGISSEAIAEMLQKDSSVADGPVAADGREPAADEAATTDQGADERFVADALAMPTEALGTPASLVDPFSAAAAEEAAPAVQGADLVAEDQVMESAVVEDTGSRSSASIEPLPHAGLSHPFDSSDVVVPS